MADPWFPARVVAVHRETARAKTFRLDVGRGFTHRAGQHVKVRLTAPDGYTASRSYSIATAPDGGSTIDLTVERLPDGEVSGFLHDVVEPGDELELRGPLGGRFVWDGTTPALLVGGGSGVVPLMSMLRLARATGQSGLVRMVVSARGPEDLLYRDELPGPETTVLYSRAPSLHRPAGRIGSTDLAPAVLPEGQVFICGSSGFADAAGRLLVGLGVDPGRIRVERFGPSAA